ncbi:hypothetical protein ADUPG1_013516 [Aduncisulcus paluster]|uniref:Uncharacterized protein n=1 Tax=Aduncisulcus paluster TaxID=2918883 RepID=A0ABQ5K7B1_9EUKA|nr:hypothetical protein ADUPG1_013516 [Aduncisulcus paluster]
MEKTELINERLIKSRKKCEKTEKIRSSLHQDNIKYMFDKEFLKLYKTKCGRKYKPSASSGLIPSSYYTQSHISSHSRTGSGIYQGSSTHKRTLSTVNTQIHQKRSCSSPPYNKSLRAILSLSTDIFPIAYRKTEHKCYDSPPSLDISSSHTLPIMMRDEEMEDIRGLSHLGESEASEKVISISKNRNSTLILPIPPKNPPPPPSLPPAPILPTHPAPTIPQKHQLSQSSIPAYLTARFESSVSDEQDSTLTTGQIISTTTISDANTNSLEDSHRNLNIDGSIPAISGKDAPSPHSSETIVHSSIPNEIDVLDGGEIKDGLKDDMFVLSKGEISAKEEDDDDSAFLSSPSISRCYEYVSKQRNPFQLPHDLASDKKHFEGSHSKIPSLGKSLRLKLSTRRQNMKDRADKITDIIDSPIPTIFKEEKEDEIQTYIQQLKKNIRNGR